MSEFFQVGYQGKELSALNIVCCFQNLLHFFHKSKFDGITLDKFVLSDSAELLALHVFPWEEPTPSDLWLLNNAIHCLCSGTSILPCIIGRFIQYTHLLCR
jgi:hypothetical protein